MTLLAPVLLLRSTSRMSGPKQHPGHDLYPVRIGSFTSPCAYVLSQLRYGAGGGDVGGTPLGWSLCRYLLVNVTFGMPGVVNITHAPAEGVTVDPW